MPRRKRNFLVPDNIQQHRQGLAERFATFKNSPEYELWMQHLTPHQRKEARRTGWVPVLGSHGTQFLVGIDPIYGGSPVSQLGIDRYGQPHYRHRCFNVSRCSTVDESISKIMLIQADELLFTSTAGG